MSSKKNKWKKLSRHIMTNFLISEVVIETLAKEIGCIQRNTNHTFLP